MSLVLPCTGSARPSHWQEVFTASTSRISVFRALIWPISPLPIAHLGRHAHTGVAQWLRSGRDAVFDYILNSVSLPTLFTLFCARKRSKPERK